jgi:glutamate--cysteine ligase
MAASMSIPQSGGGPIERPEQLAEYLEAGCKPRRLAHRDRAREVRLLPRHAEAAALRRRALGSGDAGGAAARFGWSPIFEGDNIIGLEKDGANVSLEPGGQLELSGAPLETIHQTCDEVNEHLREVREVADRIGVGFIGLGAAPIWTHEDMPMMPKGRYR